MILCDSMEGGTDFLHLQREICLQEKLETAGITKFVLKVQLSEIVLTICLRENLVLPPEQTD